MCGIVGYIGTRQAVPIIYEGLRRLEYRGYDSAGIAVQGDFAKTPDIRRAEGKLKNLGEALNQNPMAGDYGIGHTRWATHGKPTEENAHPHRDCSGNTVVVHNGIVENYLHLRVSLTAEGHVFKTETDTEAIAHLVEKHFFGNLEDAVRKAIGDIRGVFALCVMSSADPHKIVVARSGPPLVVGQGNGEYFIASDVPAILKHTRDMYFLQDGDMGVLTKDGVKLTDFDGNSVERQIMHVAWDASMAEKNGYRHFMLKEIFEQPRTVRDTQLGRIKGARVALNEIGISESEFSEFKQVKIVACGTSWHAALVGKTIIEKLVRVPVEVDYGSEFRYRDPIIQPRTLTICVSQSGETADTLAAQTESKAKGSKTLAISNVVGSMLSRECDGTFLTIAGPEMGVASTKAFTGQLTAFALIAVYMAQVRGKLSETELVKFIEELQLLPEKLNQVLKQDETCEMLASVFTRLGVADALCLGRGIHFPIALEGALKIKEVSYIHAEGYPAGEMKHGPNALIDEKLPVVIIATREPGSEESKVRYEKTLSNMQEVKARGGVVIAIACEDDEAEVRESGADHVIPIPGTIELLLPILEVVPLQLLAYHIAVRKGCDVDQPRNLAKSVTVE